MSKITGIFFPSVVYPNQIHYYGVGESWGVTHIEEHQAQGEGDKWYYDVYFSDNHVERIFNFSLVIKEGA